MNDKEANIKISVDLTNPGQFFACCGLLELSDRLWPGAEGWFNEKRFQLRCNSSFSELISKLRQSVISNTMSNAQALRLNELSSKSKKERDQAGLEDEKKALEAVRREAPILFQSSFELTIDWFLDEHSGGSRFKTWAGQQSVLDIATAMHAGLCHADVTDESTLWKNARGVGLPFNFDSELGGQGSALDIGFSFDPLAATKSSRIVVTCKPALELLSFIGLQRFRPRELPGQNRFVFSAWKEPLSVSVAAAVSCQAIRLDDARPFEFRLLYRTKYLKSFLPAIPFQ